MPPLLSGIRGVCFDVGNVLCGLNHERVIGLLAGFGYVVDARSFSMAELAGRDRINELARNANGATPGNHSAVRAYFAGILASLSIPSTAWQPIESELLRESDRENLWNSCMPDVFPVLDELRSTGFLMGVVSNSDGRIAELLERFGIAPYMRFILDSSVVGVEKPDPRIFRMAIERFGLPPDEIAFVGDIYEVDIVGSRGVGMRPVLVDPRGVERSDCPVIRRLGELPGLLRKDGDRSFAIRGPAAEGA